MLDLGGRIFSRPTGVRLVAERSSYIIDRSVYSRDVLSNIPEEIEARQLRADHRAVPNLLRALDCSQVRRRRLAFHRFVGGPCSPPLCLLNTPGSSALVAEKASGCRQRLSGHQAVRCLGVAEIVEPGPGRKLRSPSYAGP